MDNQPTLGDFILGLEGLATLRAWGIDPDTVKERARSIAEVVHRREELPWVRPLQHSGSPRTAMASLRRRSG